VCTVIVHVPHDDGAPVRLLAVRDEDPRAPGIRSARGGPSFRREGVRDRRAGGAWLAVDAEAGRVAVILNRADVLAADPTGRRPDLPRPDRPRRRRRRTPDSPPHAQGFNLVEATEAGARVTMWDGGALRRVELLPAST
jgi:hypothetical protein